LRFVAWIAAATLAAACAEGQTEKRAHTADTPALLRVIARTHGELTPRPATAADRARRAAWARSASMKVRPAPAKPAVIDSVAGHVAPPEPAAGPMRAIRIVPSIVTLRVGETATLTLEGLDSAGRRAEVTAARWRPNDAGLVTLERTGAVTAKAPGKVSIDAWVDSVRTSATVEVLPVIRGRVITIDGDVPRGLQVRFTAPGFADSAAVGEDGRFEFRPPATYPDTGELWIGSLDRRNAEFHPMVARLSARQTGPELNAVVVPTSWTIRSGRYAGVTLEVSADAALRRWRGVAPFARAAGYRGAKTRRVVGWPSQAFPLPVAFVRERPALAISTSDSAAFWQSVRAFEEQLGLAAFEPAELSALRSGRLGVEVVIDPTTPPDAMTWASWTASGDLNDARVAVRKPADLRNAALIAHEMLHALGFGHAVEWRSVMTGVASPSVTTLTAQDVAYVQLIHRLRAAQSAFNADVGFLEAAEGERRGRP
jgi:hypothetical protein